LLDAVTIDVGAVRAVQIRDDHAALTVKQPCMSLGDVAFGQHQIIALHATDADLRPFEDLSTFRAPLLVNHDREHRRFHR